MKIKIGRGRPKMAKSSLKAKSMAPKNPKMGKMKKLTPKAQKSFKGLSSAKPSGTAYFNPTNGTGN